MVNIPTHEIVLEEKIDWNGKIVMNGGLSGYADDRKTMYLKLSRNLTDDSFNLEAPKMSDNSGVVSFVVNNQTGEGVVSLKQEGDHSVATAHRSMFKSVELSKTTQIAVSDNVGVRGALYSIALFPKKQPINENITMGDNDYLKLVSYNSVMFNSKNVSSMSPGVISKSITPTEIGRNNTYIVPVPIKEDRGNKTLFEIYSKNDDNESTFADFSTDEGKLLASSLGKTGMKTYFRQASSEESKETFKDAHKVGSIEIFDNQFYNYDNGKVETGYGKYAEQGLLIPYNFKGEFKEETKFTPNYAFKDLKINMTHTVDQPLLDKYEGKVIMTVEDTQQTAGPYQIISSDKIEMLSDNDPSIIGLKRISHEEGLAI